jgi:hypothetical protein
VRIENVHPRIGCGWGVGRGSCVILDHLRKLSSQVAFGEKHGKGLLELVVRKKRELEEHNPSGMYPVSLRDR